MARKRKVEEHENHERWLVSYADFITLLFAFFVVMYSISSVNEGKYRVLSSTLASAFSNTAKSLDPIQQGKKINEPIIQHKSINKSQTLKKRKGVDFEVMPTPKEVAQMQKIADEIQFKLQKLVDNDEIKVSKTNKGVEIEIKSNILFASGRALLHAKAKNILRDIADVLIGTKTPINIEGFTDNVPIKTAMFPSNWELSAARAANVAHLFSKSGIKPIRLSAIGFGEYQPVAENNTANGRRMNRRINVVVLNRVPKKRKRLASLNRDRGKQSTPKNGLPFVNLFSPIHKNSTPEPSSKIIEEPIKGSINRNQGLRTEPKIISLGGKEKSTSPPSVVKKIKKPTLFTLPPPTLIEN